MLKLVVRDHDNLFVLAEACHFSGIGFLLYKLSHSESCEGALPAAGGAARRARRPRVPPGSRHVLRRVFRCAPVVGLRARARAHASAPRPCRPPGISLKSQELTAIFLGIRLYCSIMMEYDVHTLLDALTLAATGWVVWSMRRGQLARSYAARKDSVRLEYILGGAAALACVAHPSTKHWLLNRVLWALCVYLEAISVLPQLRMLQREPAVERWTANYVFALGCARFFSCAHWLLQLFDGNSFLFTALGTGLWPAMVLLSEVVQTLILADFCYYYVRSVASGEAVMRLPSLV